MLSSISTVVRRDSANMVATPLISIQLLGGFRVSIDGITVADDVWRGRRPAAIIKLLALAPEHRLHREQIMDTLWTDLEPNAQTNNLNLSIHRARRTLASVSGDGARLLTRDGEIVVLGAPDRVDVDVEGFQHAIVAAWEVSEATAFEHALARYTGELLPDDRYLGGLETTRTMLRASMVTGMARLAQLYDEQEDTWRAIQMYERLATVEPSHEDAHAALMRLYASVRQHRRALAQYVALSDILRCELDVEPGEATRALNDAIADSVRDADASTASTTSGTPERDPAWFGATPPLSLTSFLGREREIAEISHLLTRSRLVTLTGSGGIGKTRLALTIAYNWGERCADGVAFVDLSPMTDTALVPAALARAIGIQEPGDRSLLARVTDWLQTRNMLLVLDNLEHVIDIAPDIALLAQACPGLRILVTSRARLRVRGEVVYAVPPLDLPPGQDWHRVHRIAASSAVALFLDRAAEVLPAFTLTSENAPIIAEICHRLGGIPLAIELAAARSRILSPHDLLPRLDRQLSILAGGSRDLPDRQRTIRGTIAWSDALLASDVRALFRKLGVFVGGWTLAAVESVLAEDSGDTLLDGLAALVDASLVMRQIIGNGEARFAMLEPIHEYAIEQLQAGDATTRQELARRHAHYYAWLAQHAAAHLESADQARWLDSLEREEGNLRASLDWLREEGDVEAALTLVNALKQFWFMRGRILEGFDETLRVIDLPGSTGFPALRADALNTAGFLARESDERRSEQLCLSSLELARELDDRQRMADALANLGYLALQHGHHAAATTYFEEVLHTSQQLDNQQGIADALSFLGLIALERGDMETAWEMNEESLRIWSKLHDRQGMAWAHTQLGHVAVQSGTDRDAFDHFMTSLHIASDLTFYPGVTWAIDGLAQLALRQHYLPLAARLAAVATSIRETSGNPRHGREQIEFDRLHAAVATALGSTAVAEIWSSRHDWDLTDVRKEITATFEI